MASKQSFKAIYFPDYKTINPNSKGFVLAFGERTKDLYQTVAPLSSHEVRELLGTNSFVELEASARKEGLPVGTYCIWKLRKAALSLPNPILISDSSASANKKSGEINPIHLTFKGGSNNPLHNWYSFLEGYSPKYVEYILDNFTQKPNTVYDPFAGTGVTPIVAAKRGLLAFYSEINPLLQFLVQTKVAASGLSKTARKKTLGELENISGDLNRLIMNAQRNRELHHTYRATFNKSDFFDENTFDQVLRARTFIDELSYSNQIVADIVLVSVLNSLIPSSLLQRAGDLRYKTEEELKQKSDFIESIKNNLATIIDDIKNIEPLPVTPILIAENAKLLDNFPDFKIDALITSPPYLNGTNYFRNTKVELWFLRSIKNQDDLAGFRRATVTAGINDVTQKKKLEFVTPEIEAVVELLEKKAYDRRIPKMVADYFQDIHRVFDGLRKHLNNDADIAIDIGDSFYGGVKVPTDDLFTGTLKKLGYRFKKCVLLRKRMSRSGEVLKQVLLIFKAPGRKATNHRQPPPYWHSNWLSFKKELPHRREPFCKRNWGHPLHSLCSYQGKMKPSLAHYLVKTFAKKGDTILDPFAGVGTIPFEAALNGIRSFGFEISTAALGIAKAKLGIAEKDECLSLIDKLESFIEKKEIDGSLFKSAKLFGFNKALVDYYEKKTLREIVKAREYFKLNPPVTPSENLVFASLLHILHGNRPYALSRRSHGITPFAPTGKFEYKNLIEHLKNKVSKSLSVELPADFVEGEVLFQDATQWWPRRIDNLDAIITSPPFFDSTRFYLSNWLRLWFSGWEEEDFENRPHGFVDEKQKEGFAVYEPILRQARERLKNSGVVVFHLGKSKKCNMAEKLSDVAKRWFKIADVFEENVEDTESHGIRDKGTVVRHQFLVLR